MEKGKVKKHDVVGIGNPLMDVMIKAEDDEIAELDLEKGSMKLVDEKGLEEFENKLSSKEKLMVPGGSVANTLTGVAMLGGKVVFIGKVGEDEHGRIYEQKLIGGKVYSKIVKDKGRTGRVISLVTPDSERTFVTYLGCCTLLKEEDILEDDIKDAKILHLTGYQLEDPGLRKASMHAISLANKHGTKVSVDLADPALVKRAKVDLLEILQDCDILFANEEEARALTGMEPEDALEKLSESIEIVVIKLGPNGSIACRGKERSRTIAKKVVAVDTTGAGDMYAAGILYGLTHDLALERSMRLASHAAARIVQTMGARLKGDLKDLL